MVCISQCVFTLCVCVCARALANGTLNSACDVESESSVLLGGDGLKIAFSGTRTDER